MTTRFLAPALALCLLGFFLNLSPAVAQQALAVGDKAPDFEIETFDGKTIKLSDRFGEDGHPTIILFSRANW